MEGDSEMGAATVGHSSAGRRGEAAPRTGPKKAHLSSARRVMVLPAEHPLGRTAGRDVALTRFLGAWFCRQNTR
jgi:hypothetical protein